MRHLLNTLYILTPNAYLVKDGENIVVRIDDEETLRVPIQTSRASSASPTWALHLEPCRSVYSMG